MKLIEYFFMALRGVAFGFFPAGHWKMGCPAQNGVHSSPRTKNSAQVLLDNSRNMHYHSHEMNIMFITIYPI